MYGQHLLARKLTSEAKSAFTEAQQVLLAAKSGTVDEETVDDVAEVSASVLHHIHHHTHHHKASNAKGSKTIGALIGALLFM